jgi:E3 ubiquitin-protein ligase SIAH1
MTLPENLSQNLLIELECPVCLEYMLPPITLCKNGHDICGHCKPKLKHCHTCRGPILDMRSQALEKLARRLQYPCRFRKFGCAVILNADKMTDHQQNCPRIRFNCPMIEEKHTHCPWECSLEDMMEHLKTEHGNRFHEVNGTFSVKLKLLRQMNTYDCAMHALDQIFYIVIETHHDEVCGCVQYIGRKKTAYKYRYELSIQKVDKTDQVSVYHKTRGCTVKRQDIYDKGRCLRINYDDCKHLMNKDRTVRIVVKVTEAVRRK